MLSYRHAFHAGNRADVLKHMLLVALLGYLNQKDKPYWVIDTHAGAGLYALDMGYATKLAEYQDGIARLLDQPDCPPLVADYLEIVRACNGAGPLRRYPGSPWIASRMVRRDDRLRLFELHTTDIELLARQFHGLEKQVVIQHQDGLAGLKACLPPPPRRALVLIDPPYENKADYGMVVAALKDSLTRFATGTYALWYPLLGRLESRELPERLKKLPAKWLNVSVSVAHAGTLGMHGSGMFIINPPWTLQAALKDTLPWLTRVLARDEHASFTLESQDT